MYLTSAKFLTLGLLVFLFHIPQCGCLPQQQQDNVKEKNTQSVKSSLIRKETKNIFRNKRESRNSASQGDLKSAVKDYSQWRVVRVYVPTVAIWRTLLNSLTNQSDVNILDTRQGGDGYSPALEVELALGPSVNLQSRVSSAGLPPLCSLDNNERASQMNNNFQVRGRPSKTPPMTRDQQTVEGDVADDVTDTPCPEDHEGEGDTTKINEKGEIVRQQPEQEVMLKWKTVVKDLGLLIRVNEPRQVTGGEMLSWDAYYRYDSIVRFIAGLADDYSTVDYIKMKETEEGRDIIALVFASNTKQVLTRYSRFIEATQKVKKTKRTGRDLDNKVKMNSERFTKERRVRKRARSQTSKRKKVLKKKAKKKKKRKHKKAILRDRKRTERLKSQSRAGKKQKKKKKGPKPIILIEAGAHAREWISPAVATYLSQQLADAGKTFLKHLTVILVPLANPDGYEYSHTIDRMWRKNRRNTSREGCFGVDLNRNWGMSWGNTDGASFDPCSYQYCGTAAFSEPETSAIKDLAEVYMNKIELFITLHSYGQLLIYPWGYTVERAPKKGRLNSMARKMQKHLSSAGTKSYTFGQSSWILYTAAGTSDDYMYSKGIRYSFTLELPNYNSFVISPDEIIPTATQLWEAFVCTLGDVSKNIKVKNFCDKRIVRVVTSDNVTISAWVKKTVPLEKAKAKVLKRHENKQKGMRHRRLQEKRLLAKKRNKAKKNRKEKL